MNKRSAFTITETLACVCIIAVLAGLLFPVYSSVRRRDAQSLVSNNLHSIGLAIAMYRADDGGDAIYGDMYAMGLPPTLNQLRAYGVPAKIQFGPQGEQEGWRAAGHVMYLPPDQEANQPYKWSDYVRKNQEATVTWASVGFTDPGVPMRSPFSTYRGLGVRLDTSVLQRVRAGDYGSYTWWE